MNRTVIDVGDRSPRRRPPGVDGADRREALAWLASGAALALAGCGKPREEILPYVETPDGLQTGVAQRYATTLPLAGFGRGVLVTSHEGRPTKVSGSPRHPASRGATDVFAEAEVLSLYDPARLKAVDGPDGPAAWTTFETELLPKLAAARARRGAGLALLTGRITSPTELRLIEALRLANPQMAWRRYEPIDDDPARAGARLAFGRVLTVRPRLDAARVILCVEADPLGPGAEQIAANSAYALGRRAGSATFSRLYSAEAGWSLTGLNADHRLACTPAEGAALLQAVAAALGVGPPRSLHHMAPATAHFAATVAADLGRHPGHAIVLAGAAQPPAVHALAHAINRRLEAPVEVIEPVDPHEDDHGASLAALAADLHSGRIETLIVLGSDPLHDAPALGLEPALRRVFSVHAATHANATAAACRWRLPLSHPLESWGDVCAPDGTPSLVQPLIRPLYDSRTAGEILAMLDLEPNPKASRLTRATWRRSDEADAEFEARWRRALVDGTIAAARPLAASPAVHMIENAPPDAPRAGFVLTLGPDPTVFDGRYADNAWLQECPKPFTHEVWGASVAVAPEDAARLGITDGDRLRLHAAGAAVEIAARITRGQAPGTLSGLLGGGRSIAGPIGRNVGVNLAPLRGVANAWSCAVEVTRAPGRDAPPRFTTSRRIDGEAMALSPVVGVAALARMTPLDAHTPTASLLPAGGTLASPAWAMVIDANACTGCNACVVACQSENNVPVVGPHEVARGRDMHWLRIDAYDVGPASAGSDEVRPAFQPIPCMQCEHAPCEPVCPVEASVHDHEGLNAQVYNRCIGTRFCESNCPYQVRRFNFYGYGHDQAYADLGAESYAAQKNPEVTVRSRGVMEKCTYCVQRISAARRTAEKEDRPIRDGEVTTACQDACPTHAIRLGDLGDPRSPIHAIRAQPRHYALLAELGARPRTTYLARLRNSNPALAERE